MQGQGALDLGDFDAPVSRDALAQGVFQTLEALGEAGVLTARHAGIVALLRSEASDYAYAHGIARTNYARLIGEHLTMLLEMEAPASEEDTADDDGDRVTKLAAFLDARRRASDVRDPEAS